MLVPEPCVETIHPSRRAGPAQGEIERSDVLEPFAPCFALASDEWMLEQRQKRHGRELLGCGRCDTQQKGARSDLRQRLSGRVIGLDSPTPQEGRNASCKLPVGSYERRSLARLLERLSQRKRDRLCFGALVLKLGHSDAAKAPLLRAQLLPFVRKIGRRHRVGDRARAGRR